MARRMADPAFLAEQRVGIFAPQVKRVNEFCDELMRREPGSFVPYVAPHYDAENAVVLVISSNPGPRAGELRGSGFLSFENDDATAERMGNLYESVGLHAAHVLPWNAYPWDVHEVYGGGLTPKLIEHGVAPLKELLDMHPKINAVVAHGGDAHRSLRTFARNHSSYVDHRGLKVFKTRHTSNLSFALKEPHRTIELAKMREVYRAAMRHVGLMPIDSAEDSKLVELGEPATAGGIWNAKSAHAYVRTLTSDQRELLRTALREMD